MDVDLSLVFECLRHHDPQNSVAQKDSLLTIASLCSENDEAKNIFRENGGLGYVLNMLTTVTDDDVKGTVLYTLGCATERNVYSQKRLCSDALFKYLLCQITSVKTSIKLKKSATFLLICLVTNNSAGQNLIRSSGCMDGLLNSFRNLEGSSAEDSHQAFWIQAFWIDILKTLCSCVNNPRQEENQFLCAAAFPVILKLLMKVSDVEVIKLLASFISLTVANSESNQERFGLLGGVNVMTSCLQNLMRALVKQPSQPLVNAVSGLITALGISSCDHEMNIQTLTELKVIPLLVQVLSMEVVSSEIKLKVILTISVITRSSETSQKQLVDCDGMVLLVQILMENQSNEEMTKAVTSVLQSCVAWVSALGTENTLYSKTLDDRQEQSSQLKVSKVHVDKLEMSQYPVTPTQLKKVFHNDDTKCSRCHKELESYAGSVAHSVTSENLGKLQKQVGHLEEKFDLVLRYLDTPRHQKSLGKTGEKQQRTFEKQKNLEEMMSVISKKSNGKSEIYQKRGGNGAAPRTVDGKQGEPMGKAREGGGKEYKSYDQPKDAGGVILLTGSKNAMRGWNTPLLCRQVDQNKHCGIDKHCESEGVRPEDKCGTNWMEPGNGHGTSYEQADNSAFNFLSDDKQFRDEIQFGSEHSNFKCKQNDSKIITAADAEQFVKPEDKIKDVLPRCKQNNRCPSDRVSTDINIVNRDKQNTGGSHLWKICRMHPYGNTWKSGRQMDEGENFENRSWSTDKKAKDMGNRKRRCQSQKVNQLCQPVMTHTRCGNGFKEPDSSESQLGSSKNLLKAAMEANRHVCSGHKGLVIAVKEGNNLSIRKVAPRKNLSIHQKRKNITADSQSERIRNLLSDIPLSSKVAKRRKRQDFSPDEVKNLIREVKRQGKHWNSILWSCNFKKGRTAVDLKDKYRRLMAKTLRQKISVNTK